MQRCPLTPGRQEHCPEEESQRELLEFKPPGKQSQAGRRGEERGRDGRRWEGRRGEEMGGDGRRGEGKRWEEMGGEERGRDGRRGDGRRWEEMGGEEKGGDGGEESHMLT